MKRLGQWNITALVLVLVLAMLPFSNVSHAYQGSYGSGGRSFEHKL